MAYGYRPTNLSWKYDGTQIGFNLLGLGKIKVSATHEIMMSKIKPPSPGRTGLGSGHLAWSPIDDRYLFLDFTFSPADYDL